MKTDINQRWLVAIITLIAAIASANVRCIGQTVKAADAEPPVALENGQLTIREKDTRLEMLINSTQVIRLEEDIARANVQNDTLVEVRPMSRNQMLVTAKATGFTQIDLHNRNGEIRSVQITIMADARELEYILRAEFPSSTISVRPIQNAVILSGAVTSDVHVTSAVQIAQQYYPTVINRIEVLGVHTVMLHVQIMEVSRTKLRQAGVDWSLDIGNDFITQTASGVLSPGAVTPAITASGNETFKVGVVDGGNGFFTYLRLLKQNNLVKVLADPTLTAVDGRPASFNSGGEFPVLVPAGLGQVGVEFREFGTRLDFVAKVRGDGLIHLEVRPMISEVDDSRSVQINGISVPGLRSRYVETAVDMQAGQTLALAGLLQVRQEARVSGIPGLSDLPYLGVLFRDVREVQNEVELLITVTPDFAAGMDPSEVPQNFPGYNTNSPSDKELFLRGYIEVPNLCNDAGAIGGTVINQPASFVSPMDEQYSSPDMGSAGLGDNPAIPSAAQSIANAENIKINAATRPNTNRPGGYPTRR